MMCPRCNAASTILTARENRRVRQCGNGHRWQTVEQAVSEPTALPATPDSVLELRAQCLSLRQIAAKLLMSPKTVQQYLHRGREGALQSIVGSWR